MFLRSPLKLLPFILRHDYAFYLFTHSIQRNNNDTTVMKQLGNRLNHPNVAKKCFFFKIFPLLTLHSGVQRDVSLFYYICTSSKRGCIQRLSQIIFSCRVKILQIHIFTVWFIFPIDNSNKYSKKPMVLGIFITIFLHLAPGNVSNSSILVQIFQQQHLYHIVSYVV